MRIPRYLCALLPGVALAGVIALPAPAQGSAKDGFRAGLKSAIGKVANLIETGVDQNRACRETRELDRALHELVYAFAGGRGHRHHPPGHHYGWANWSWHGKNEHSHQHSGHFTSGFHMTNSNRYTSSGSGEVNDRNISRPTDKKSQGTVPSNANFEPTAKQVSIKTPQGNEGGAAGQGRIANGTRILANPFDGAGGAVKKGGDKTNIGKNSNANNVGGMAGKKGNKQGQAASDAKAARQAPKSEGAMPVNGNAARSGKNAPSNVAGNNKSSTRNAKGAPGSLVGNNAQGLKRQSGAPAKTNAGDNAERAVMTKNGGGATAKGKVGGNSDRIANAKNGPGSLVGKKGAGAGRTNPGSAKAGTGNIVVTINGSNDVVNINLGGATTKPRTNGGGNAAQAKNGPANNANVDQRGLAKNSAGTMRQVGNAKDNQTSRPINANAAANGKNGVGNLVGANVNKNASVNTGATAKTGLPRQGNQLAARNDQEKSAQPKNITGTQALGKNVGKANNQNFTAARHGAANQMSRPTGSIRNGASAAGQARTASTARRK